MRLEIIFSSLLLTLPWLVILYVVNFVGELILLGDPCQYHSNDTSLLFDAFYDLPSSNGYHPAPTWLNLTLTVLLPALFLGYRSAKRLSTYAKV
jgi:hypothetical protein